MKPKNTPLPSWARVIRNFIIVVIGVVSCWTLVDAAAPLAGTLIQNQAAATYKDSTGADRTATSNLVTTEVQYVPAFTLITDGQSKQFAPGDTATFPHVLTNTGNGTETYTLTVANGTTGSTFNFDSVAIYADADQNGVADNSTDLDGTTVTLAAGEQFYLVAAGTVPGGATNTQTDTIVVGANDDETTTTALTNTDTVTVSEDAVVTIRKSASIATGAIGATITYRLEVTNTGNKTATHVLIYDAIPAGTTYVAGSGVWSSSGTALTDGTVTADPAGITYEKMTGPDAVQAIIASLPVNNTQYITFAVTVDTGTLPIHVDNHARLCYNDGSTAPNIQPSACGDTTPADGIPDDGTAGIESNHVPFDVVQIAGVDVNDNNPSSTDPSTTDAGDTTPVNRNDVVKVASANPGDTVAFDNVITNTKTPNTGIGIDTFNITLSGSSFPAGTTFQLLKADGSTTLTDTNGDSIPDTGPLAANASYHVVVNAVLPPGVHGNGPYDVVKTATSVFDPTVSDTVTDRLGQINYHELTLTPNGTGQIYPGGSIVYTHTIENIGNVTEGGAAGLVTLTNTDNVSSPDWNSVLYYDADSDGVLDASELAAPITDLHTIVGADTLAGLSPGERATLFVKVFAPASAAAGDVNVTSITAAGATISTVTATDVTTIVLGQLRLYKTQVLDANCDGTETTFGTGQIQAKPGECILYKVEARNEGFDLVKAVVVSDSVPANTTYACAPAVTTGVLAAAVTHGTITAPTCGQTGIISATMGEDVVGDVPDNGLIIPAGGSETLTFGVKINQ